MKRYDNLDEAEAGRSDAMFEHPDGEWVRYNDVEVVLQNCDNYWKLYKEMRAERAVLIEALRQVMAVCVCSLEDSECARCAIARAALEEVSR